MTSFAAAVPCAPTSARSWFLRLLASRGKPDKAVHMFVQVEAGMSLVCVLGLLVDLDSRLCLSLFNCLKLCLVYHHRRSPSSFLSCWRPLGSIHPQYFYFYSVAELPLAVVLLGV